MHAGACSLVKWGQCCDTLNSVFDVAELFSIDKLVKFGHLLMRECQMSSPIEVQPSKFKKVRDTVEFPEWRNVDAAITVEMDGYFTCWEELKERVFTKLEIEA